MRLQCISACGMPRALDMRLGYMTCTQLDTTTSSLPKANVQQDLLAPSDPDTSNCSIRLLQFNDHMHGIRKKPARTTSSHQGMLHTVGGSTPLKYSDLILFTGEGHK